MPLSTLNKVIYYCNCLQHNNYDFKAVTRYFSKMKHHPFSEKKHKNKNKSKNPQHHAGEGRE